jgi:hypothetical protein
MEFDCCGFVFKEKSMNARRFLTFVAAILVTVGQGLVFATDTAASAEALFASGSNPASSSSLS